MPLYSLIEYSDVYLKRSETLWQYYRGEPAIDNNNDIIDFSADNSNSNLFKFKQQITGKTENGGTKNVEIKVPLKYLCNFWRIPEIFLINYEICLQLTWAKYCSWECSKSKFIFEITDNKLYVSVVTLSTQDNMKLPKQLEYGFKEQLIETNIYLKQQIKRQTDV